MLTLFDTLSKSKRDINVSGRPVRLYSCGPTVYDHAHIGNLRSFIFADTIVRTLEYNRQEVDWVMNITDVDDKTIKKTIAEFGETATPSELKELTSRHAKTFLADLEALNIDTKRIRFINVSDVIPQIQKFILELLDKGYAYTADDGSVYFSIEKYQTDFGDYGELVGTGFLEGKKVGARVAVDEYEKDNLSDFALWKARHADDGQIFWTHGKLADGRPGWHIECSVINQIAFDSQPTDIHTGGVDLIFPHHTNEIAQSQPFYKPFTKHWAHSEHLQINGSRMAKREKNFITLSDLQKSSTLAGPALRYLFLQSDLRSQQNFTDESFEAAQNGLQRLYNTYELSNSDGATKVPEKFASALNNDLNTAEAIATLHETDLSKATQDAMDTVFGLGLNRKPIELPDEVTSLVTERQGARDSKDFTRSDELRAQIESLGYEVKDTNDGQKVTKK